MPEDILKIMETIPHRYPFLMLDRVLEMTADSVVGLKNVTINEPFFQGHFPGEPIMPGVMIIEAMAQAGAVLGLSLLQHLKGNSVYFMGMDKVRFRKPVRPGDQLLIKAQLMKQKGTIFKIKAEAFVEGQLVAEAELLATLGLPKKTPEDLE
jgi:3-hydroxyacyl-[acyl-carrier-protein] dehydratase